MNLRVGTSGFSYDDWKGHFYPPTLKKSEMLPYYARRFRTVEVNSTYYRVPPPATMQQMARKVPEGFEFTIKAHRDMTHTDRFQPAVFQAFRDAVAPLGDLGMLGCVLAQFPWSFRPGPESEAFLREAAAALAGLCPVVEFRNAGWLGEDTFQLLRSLELGFCCVDEPRLKGLLPPVTAATSSIGYVRFHGRNAAHWWQHEQAFQRYDYLYTEEELCEWKPRIQELAGQVEKTYVFFNNHYQGKAAQNALQMIRLLELAEVALEPVQGGLWGAME